MLEMHSVDSAASALKKLVAVAWLSILLGFMMQGFILLSRSSFGIQPTMAQLLVDLTQGVTWSFFVCAGVGLGTTIAKARTYLGGLIGFIAAPIALGVAKGGQKVMTAAIGAADKPVILSLATLGILRAIQYGVLGWLLAWLVAKQETRVSRFLLAGAAAGILIGGLITILTAQAAASKGTPLLPPQLITTSINEIVFPVFCALVVFIALQVGKQIKLVSAEPKPA